MRHPLVACVVLCSATVLAGLARPANASFTGTEDVRLGDKIDAEFARTPGLETHDYRFWAPALTQVSVKLKAAKKTTLVPGLTLRTDEGVDLQTALKGKLKIAVEEDGWYILRVVAESGEGAYNLKTKGKYPKKYGATIATTEEFTFSAIAGSRVSVKVKKAKKSAALPAVLSIEGPTLAAFDGPAAAKVTVDALPEDGSFLMLCQNAGQPGDMVVKIKVKAPKGGDSLDLGIQRLTGSYVGSATCAGCHQTKYDQFIQSGHPYKLNKIEGNQVPTYPFTDLSGALEQVTDDDDDESDPKSGTDNTLGTPQTYADVSYVIGGYGWKARWIDKDGYVVTGSSVQYNYATDAMASYHDNETDKPYNCGNCHTTGWQHYDETLNDNRQDDLPGMDGTFAEGGVGCEACHGGGSYHVASMSALDIIRNATPRTLSQLQAEDMGHGLAVSCSECHTRDGERDYPSFLSGLDNALLDAGMPGVTTGGRIAAKGGLIRHHEQFDEVFGIDPDTLLTVRNDPGHAMWDCNTCHDPHKSTRWGDQASTGSGVNNSNADCLACHEGKDENKSLAMNDFACITCHMPKLAKSAVKTQEAEGTRAALGDIRSHIFSIDLSRLDQLTEDGKFAYPYLSGVSVCRQCHHDQPGGEFDLTDSAIQNYTFHD
ncbi:MAG: multiheme c-type cytochrome [Planctomycetota bacterium]|jgi:hypothetical protein